jgi:3',5'-cyclic AMP phosphodiesterase CpdA
MKSLKPGLQRVNKREIYLKGVKDVVLLGDNGCRPPSPKSISVFKRILKIKTAFFIIIGDLVYKGQGREYKKLLTFCKKEAKAPIFAVAGNHDLPEFSRFCGSSTYAIILDDFVLCILDNSHRKFSQKDLNFLIKELKKHKEKKFFILFHIPPPTKIHKSHLEQSEWLKLKKILGKFKKRIVCIFCGHIHTFADYSLAGYRVFLTGGGGAQLFNLKKGDLEIYHAVKLNFIDKDRVEFNLIPIGSRITGRWKKYRTLKLV